jgi:hypothetical protein
MSAEMLGNFLCLPRIIHMSQSCTMDLIFIKFKEHESITMIALVLTHR